MSHNLHFEVSLDGAGVEAGSAGLSGKASDAMNAAAPFDSIPALERKALWSCSMREFVRVAT